ncbi:MAG: AAA family ATPase [Candidatus Aenigmarchaeota archaeon]|nr:AAA family ATPase [Candidatus Aenigmarchaeota archaeon]
MFGIFSRYKSKEKYPGFDLDSYQPLPITYHLRYSILEKVKKREDVLPDIQGREEVKKDVLRALLSGAHPYLVSEEGTGKTRLARSLTKLLPPIPVIKGCPYNDDPKWPSYLLCPRCRESENPAKEYGIEFVSGERRFSRIQGNEYTNEAKLLGLKDIQAIAQGRSPSDPQVFTGTGVFRANRGILFVDELPAIRTKVQVLLHPVLEEKKAILEEYNWEHPLDLVLIATGNPQGFAHVNEVPRPLLDRLELIYMDLPEKEIEKEIMLKERFRVKDDYYHAAEQVQIISYPNLKELERNVIAPWWIIDLVNEAVRHSRKCGWLDKKASIRGTTKGIDHTYASVELANRKVANLKDVSEGLKLALRGRIGLRPDLIDFDDIKKSFTRSDEVAEDLLWNALEDFDFHYEWNGEKFASELNSLFSEGTENLTYKLQRYEELSRVIGQLKNTAREKVTNDLNEAEKELFYYPERADRKVLEEYNYSALETVVNLARHKKLVDESVKEKVFVPQVVSWSQKK